MELQRMAEQYIAARKRAERLRERIRKLQDAGVFREAADEAGPAEQNMQRVVARWRREVVRCEMLICRYDLLASGLSRRERLVLRLHFEQGISLRRIAGMDLAAWGMEKISLATLSRVRRRLVNHFNGGAGAENPCAAPGSGIAADFRAEQEGEMSNHVETEAGDIRTAVEQSPR